MPSQVGRHVAVVKGGISSEREVSLVTGTMCADGLREAGYKVTEIDASFDLAQQLIELKPDAIFNALHGRWGEDGCVQGIFEWLQIPYSHSGVAASAMAMDKELTKSMVYQQASLPTATSQIISIKALENGHPLPPPYVLKPINEGSSVGVSIVRQGDSPISAYQNQHYGKLMVENYVPGRELTVTVLGHQALTVTEIFADEWYDYSAKYQTGGSRHEVPADIPKELFNQCLRYAERAHRYMGCRSLSRTDFRWDEKAGSDGLVLLETNTQPGMTPTSLSPEQAAHCGISFPQLCQQLIEDASCQR